MSDHIVKIIPSEVTCSVTEEQADRILKLLRSKIKADRITASISADPVFVDCGSNLEAMMCPHCGAQLDFGWWGDAMETAGQSSFTNLSVVVPCCGKAATLNDLRYDLPCGFARVAFEVWNPAAELSQELLSALKELLHSPVRLIHAHL